MSLNERVIAMSNKQDSVIESARLARGYTQEQVASIIGVSRPTYINIENGKKELTLSQAESLASMLRISLDDILGVTDGAAVFCDPIESAEKYKQIILNAIKHGSGRDGKITKTKLAKIVYLADFIWYYLKDKPMSGMTYRKLPQGPVSDVYFRVLDEMENVGQVEREEKGRAFLYSITENVAPTGKLSSEEIELIEEISEEWRDKSTEDIVNFTHEQLPWQICRDGEVIPYGLITQESPEKIYGSMQL